MSDEKLTQLSLESDGTPMGTRLVTSEGLVIADVTAVNVKIRADKMVTIAIEVLPKRVSLKFSPEMISLRDCTLDDEDEETSQDDRASHVRPE